MNLMETLGEEYMTDMCSGAFFFYNDRLMKFMRTTGDTVQSFCFETDNFEHIPYDFFTGWSVFKAEPAGYRRLGDHVVAYCTRLNSTRRGIRPDNIRAVLTPASQQLNRTLGLMTTGIDNTVKVKQFLRPTFDNIEESLPRLLAGDQLSVVLDENLVIEAAVGGRADSWYNILNKTNVIGRLNRQGRAIWNDPEQSILIPSLQAA